MSRIEDRVIERIKKRAEAGEFKYGTTMERNDLSVSEWLTHAQEEAMDLAIYLEKIKQEIVYQEDPRPFQPRYTESEVQDDLKSVEEYMEEERERRMDIIGRNGNTGEHYEDQATYLYDKVPETQESYTDNCGYCGVERTMYPGDIKITKNGK